MESNEQQPLTGSAQQSRSPSRLPQVSKEASARIHVPSNTSRWRAGTAGESCCVGDGEGRNCVRRPRRPLDTRPPGAYGPRCPYGGSKPARKIAYRAAQRQPPLCGQFGEPIGQEDPRFSTHHRQETHEEANLCFPNPQRQQQQRNQQSAQRAQQRGTQPLRWRPVQRRGDKERELWQQHQQPVEQQQREQKHLPQERQDQEQPLCTPRKQDEGRQEQRMYKHCDHQQPQQGLEVPQQARPRQGQADHYTEEHRQTRKPREQPQRQQRCQQEQPPLQQQFQAQIAGRQACSRPQLSSSVPPVAVELKKLCRMYSSSFRFLSCHPLLQPQLEQQGLAPLLPEETFSTSAAAPAGAKGAEVGSLHNPMQGLKAPGQRLCSGVLPDGALPPAQEAAICGNSASSCLEELCRFELVLDPSDPEFDSAMLPGGLIMQITMGAGYPGAEVVLAALPEPLHCEPPRVDKSSGAAFPESADDVRGSQGLGSLRVAAWLRVGNKGVDGIRRSAVEMVFAKAIEKHGANTQENGDLVRTAIKAVDRHLREIFELDDASLAAATNKERQVSWTAAEQKKLEEAVILYRRVADPVLRWRNISGHVGTRTAKDCAEQFRRCRASVLSQRDLGGADKGSDKQLRSHKGFEQDSGDGGESSIQMKEGEDAPPALEGLAGTFRACDVSLLEPVTHGVSSLYLSCLRLQVSCNRCKCTTDMRVALPKEGVSLEPAGCSVNCEKCRLRMGTRIQPVIGVVGSSLLRIATVGSDGCLPKDLLPCDFVLTCDSCGASMKAREVLSGAPRSHVCRHCHSRLTFGFQGAVLGGTTVCGFGTGQKKDIRRPNVEKPHRKQDLRIVVGTPLPDHGTCKHYKKSYRWLRFPCCGKAYPCDVCHDTAEDHECEWAKRMICGFCSVEQAFANGKPCVCGKALTKDRSSAYWEGGKGCRDPTRMSRKDTRKYKLQSKQQRKP